MTAKTDFREQTRQHLGRAFAWTNDVEVVNLIDKASEALALDNPEKARAYMAQAMKRSTGVVHASLTAARSSAKYVAVTPRCSVCGKPMPGAKPHDPVLCFEHAHLA